MRKMFRDAALQAEFDEKGYVVVPLLTLEQVDDLYSYYKTENKRMDGYNGTYAEFSVLNAELSHRKKIFDKISGTVLNEANKWLLDCKPIIGNFICKEPGMGKVPVHQNWAVVDEEKYSSVSVWCPLVDTDLVNGTMGMVNGSHKFFRGARGSYANKTFDDIAPWVVENYVTFIPMKKGDAIILDDSIIHYSTDNKSDNIRLAVQLICLPQEADPWHYTFRDEPSGTYVDLYKVDPQYYQSMTNWKGELDGYELVSTNKYSFERFTQEQFSARMRGETYVPQPAAPAAKPQPAGSILDKVLAWFK